MNSTCAVLRASMVLLLVCCGCRSTEPTQPAVTRDLYLIELPAAGQWPPAGAPVNLTRREGYDDQPVFLPDGRGLLYSSRRGDQADIYRYDFENGNSVRVTNTPGKEYGPSPLPDGSFSVILVDQEWNMQVWKYDSTGSNPERLFPAENEIHYHAWANEDTLALHTFENRPKLILGHFLAEKAEPVYLDDNIGRCMQRVPGTNALGFVGKLTAVEWWVKVVDLETRKVRRLVQTLPGQEDFAWTPAGELLMADGAKIFRWREGRGRGPEDWEEVADLEAHGLQRITRITVGPRGARIVVVSEQAPEETEQAS